MTTSETSLPAPRKAAIFLSEACATDATHRRAEQLDALDAFLPFDRRDQLATLLTDDDVATLTHLAQHGMGDNTLRARASDLG